METESSIFLLIVAPFIGSFLGVVIERLPTGRSVIFGRSMCDGCGRQLGVLDLIPVISWVRTGGRCRHCGVWLGWFYPAIELAALAIAGWALFAVPIQLAWATAALGWMLLALAEIDRRHLLLPDALTLPLLLAGLGVAAWYPGMRLIDHLLGAALGFAGLWLLAAAYQRLRGREGLGQGDAKLFAAAGAWLGWQGLASVLLIGAASGLAWTLVRNLTGHGKPPTEPIGFGPFLALGTWLTWIWGPLGPL